MLCVADIDECQIPGMCSQQCENYKGGYKCSCFEGYALDPERNYTCKAASHEEPLLLFANRHDLREIGLESQHYREVVNGLRSAIALDFDYRDKKLFWSDVAHEKIMSTDLNGMKRPIKEKVKQKNWESVVNESINTPDGLAFDWIHKNLYWTDTGSNRIEVVSLVRQHRRILIQDDLDEPRAIVVDPREGQGWMYWSDWGENAKIEKAGLDGSSRKAIVSSDIQWPNGLTIGTFYVFFTASDKFNLCALSVSVLSAFCSGSKNHENKRRKKAFRFLRGHVSCYSVSNWEGFGTDQFCIRKCTPVGNTVGQNCHDWKFHPSLPTRANRIQTKASNLDQKQNAAWVKPWFCFVDYAGGRLYWVDAKLHVIASSDLDGGSRYIVLSSRQFIKHPFSITVFEDFVYWTDWETESIHKANKFTGHGLNSVAVQLYSPMGIHVYHPMRQPVTDPACGPDNGGCSHLCLPSPRLNASSPAYVCACPDGVAKLDHRNCEVVGKYRDLGFLVWKCSVFCLQGSFSHAGAFHF